jgi:hypothetical protein
MARALLTETLFFAARRLYRRHEASMLPVNIIALLQHSPSFPLKLAPALAYFCTMSSAMSHIRIRP